MAKKKQTRKLTVAKSPVVDNSCKACRHYDPAGVCIKYPPQVIVIAGATATIYPDISGSLDRPCGEFHRKEL